MQNMRILAEVVQSFSLNGHINTHTHMQTLLIILLVKIVKLKKFTSWLV